MSGLGGLLGEGAPLESCSRWKCAMSGEEGWVPPSRGVVRPSEDLYELEERWHQK